VALMRAYAGGSPHFDEPAVRAVAEHDVARTANLAAALTNHFLLDMSGPAGGGYADLTAPALIVHGDRDPVYPLPHGRATGRDPGCGTARPARHRARPAPPAA
jgi:hypothetical protein